ncbi:phenylalanine--tRNA ligase subunit beta [Halonatronum saccharophilum]|uniref:phenylalanine--tRNA ligase subunit beta n=1 Tax=Halonatronum saccharophilum TaxID=150060 RepID=UPI0004858676|nr:phenylalanine--tRNA ligase subunit beta [Halonatronum saccharophilum]
MKVSYNWLKEYIDFDYSPEELAHKLTLAGLEVDGVEYLGEKIEDIVVGEVKEIGPHENADKLSVCKVNIGGEEDLQIVCGAKNMKKGDKVPVAPLGMVMPNGMEIKEVKLRGVKSCGMMCSTDELELADDGVDGLFILEDDFTVGNKLVEELGLNDAIIELDLTPNFSHALSIYGVAREIAAITGNELKKAEVDLKEEEIVVNDLIEIEVKDSDLSPRYAGRVIKGVKVEESPLWLKQRLESIGVRSVNNIVDITNLILMELGQPLHAFDYNKIEDNKVIVRRANEGEKLTTLDGEEKNLDEEILVIADAQKPLCIAGVMGGENSEVTEETVDIFLESANFNPGSVRSTSKKVGIHSDASHRFERGVDINLVEVALDKAAQLISQVGGGKVAKGMIDLYPHKVEETEIKLRTKRVNKLLGAQLAKINLKRLLESLHFVVEDEGDHLGVKVPTYRVDVEKEIDLVEEIARSYGYDEIEAIEPKAKIVQGKKSWSQKVEDKVKGMLAHLGLFEVKNYSFTSPEDFDKINMPKEDSAREVIELSSPLGYEYSVMRRTLIPSLLNNIVVNLNQKVEDIGIFELAKVFEPVKEQELPKEEFKLAAAVSRSDLADRWNVSAPGFFYLKGVLEQMFNSLGIENVEFLAGELSFLHPGRTAILKVDDKEIGYLGELHPDVLENYKIKTRVTAFELDFTSIVKYSTANRAYQSLPKYPALTRDIALVVKKDVSSLEIKNIIWDIANNILESLELFDLYEGEQLLEGHKSLAYSLAYRVQDRTLTDDEVNEVQNKIEKVLYKRLGAKIRE